MMSFAKTLVAVGAAFIASTGSALAGGCLPNQPCQVPEPGSLALVGLAIAGIALVARKSKK